MNLVVLASGRGTNFSAIADAVSRGTIPNSRIVGLISNKPLAPVVALAKAWKIPVHLIDDSRFRNEGRLDRKAYEAELGQVLEKLNPDFICLAGYMLILGAGLVERWAGRVINIHPSLLPAFPGLHPHRQALATGVPTTGCTVHWVTAKVDAGPILAQGEMPIRAGDTEQTLAERLLPIEHATYVKALAELAKKQIKHGR